jgi:universal stress protein E
MMQRLDRILAVVDPTVDVQTGATKAAQLARATHASLELFACDFDPSLSGGTFFDTDQARRLRDASVARREEHLEGLAHELRVGGLQVTTHVHWDNPLHEGILRRVREFAPDLIVKDTHFHTPLRRTFFTNTDWHLIRACPVPLLLAKQAGWPARPLVLAALDPSNAHDKPAALDGDILDAAQCLARSLGGTVEAVHAFFPAALLAATTGMAGAPLATGMTVTDLLETERARVTEAVFAVAASRGLGPEAVRVLQGGAADLLPRHAERAQAAVLVMGAVARGRLKELFVGSTAERVLDRLPCDVLVVKPTDFREKLPF